MVRQRGITNSKAIDVSRGLAVRDTSNNGKPILTPQEASEFYHLLRKISIGDSKQHTYYLAASRNFIAEASYENLWLWLDYFGKNYLLPEIIYRLRTYQYGTLRSRAESSKVVIELGAGSGWLGKGLGEYLNIQYAGFDKRPVEKSTGILDVESKDGPQQLADIVKDTLSPNVIVMSSFLHCLDKAYIPKVLSAICKNSYGSFLVILEPNVEHERYGRSWEYQLRSKGCTILNGEMIKRYLRAQKNVFNIQDCDILNGEWRLYLAWTIIPL